MNNILSKVAFSRDGNNIEFTVTYMRGWEAILRLSVDSYNLGNSNGNIRLMNVEMDADNNPVAEFKDESDAMSFAAVLETMGAYSSGKPTTV